MTPGSADGRRQRTPGVVVVLTNSISSDDIKTAIKPIKDVADRVIVVGLGHAVDKLELESIASQPTRDNFIQVYNTADLSSHVKSVAESICEAEVSNE